MIWLFWLACVEEPSWFLAYVRDPETGGYAVDARRLESLSDTHPMEGDLGQLYDGGNLRFWDTRYQKGTPIRVDWHLEGETAVPEDPDGVLLFSFYGHLEDAQKWVDEQAVAADFASFANQIFPMPMAWNPAVSPLIELAPADNAAYATGSNFFVLLPDGDSRDVPLIANAGVVAHEYGHAVFHLLLTGDPYADPLVMDTTTTAGKWQAALHEGFADIQATLFTDDPTFISRSLDQPARDVSVERTLTGDLIPTEGGEVLEIFDPYPLGTVFATAVWTVRVVSEDREGTYRRVLDAIHTWQPTQKTLRGDYFLDAWAGVAQDGEREVICSSIALHFADYHIPEVCR